MAQNKDLLDFIKANKFQIIDRAKSLIRDQLIHEPFEVLLKAIEIELSKEIENDKNDISNK